MKVTIKKKTFYLLCLCIAFIAIYLFCYFFTWTTYTNSHYHFSIQHPARWQHETITKSSSNIAERWYFTYGPPTGSGRSFNGEELYLEIYNPSDKAWKEWFTQWNESVASDPSFFQKTKLTISGKQVQTILMPTALRVGPLIHNRKAYYFSGNNNETVKKMLSSFTFTK